MVKHWKNWVCIIGFIVLLIVYLVYIFKSENFENIAEDGSGIMTLAGFVVSYFVIKALFFNKYKDIENEKQSKKFTTLKIILKIVVCIIIVVGIVTIFTLFEKINYVAGVLLFIAPLVFGFILFYCIYFNE